MLLTEVGISWLFLAVASSGAEAHSSYADVGAASHELIDALSFQGSGNRVIHGALRDSAGQPIPRANIDISGSRRVVTDDSGRFRFQVSARERLTLSVRRIGFHPAELRLDPGGDTTLSIQLVPLAVELEPTMITGTRPYRSLELAGFYRRLNERKTGTNSGEFITIEEIEQKKPYRVTNLFYGRPGLKMIRIRADSWAPAGLNGCFMTVFLDRVRLNSLKERNSFVTDIDNLVGWSAVAGIEIYSTPGRVPAEYQSLAGTCGVILIWTK
jgi:hypothetical protein